MVNTINIALNNVKGFQSINKRLKFVKYFKHKIHCVKRIRIWSFSGPYFSAEWSEYLSVLSRNAGKYRPGKLCMWTLSTEWLSLMVSCFFKKSMQLSMITLSGKMILKMASRTVNLILALSWFVSYTLKSFLLEISYQKDLLEGPIFFTW